jgi:hypothetical protein
MTPRKTAAAFLAILMIAQVAIAQTQTILTVPAGGTYVLTIGQDGAKSLSGPYTVVTPGGVVIPPVVPPIVPPVVVPTNLKAVTEAALKTVPAYADRDTHVRGLAYALGFMAPQLKASPQPIAVVREGVKSLSSLAGADAPKWAPFWTAIERQIDAMIAAGQVTNNTQLADAYLVVHQVLDATIPDAGDEDGEFQGVRNYGLDRFNPEFWQMLLQVLLPLLLKLLSGI